MDSTKALNRLASMVANIRQGESETPRCEPPGEYEIDIARNWVKRVLKAQAALSEQWEAAQPAADGWEPEVEYEVWQNDRWTAGSTSLDDAKHYAAVYSQDGPVQLVKATTYREPISPGIASQAEEGSGE